LRPAILAFAAVLLLCACQPKAAEGQAGETRFAGLDQAILDWRNDIRQAQAACREGGPGAGCQNFAVACKAERAVAAKEQARGVSAKVVAGMSWDAWDPARAESLPEAGFVQFTKVGGTWSRSGPLRGDLATCRTFDA
jgi:hypothetical protein